MEQQVIVHSCDPDGTAQVLHLRRSACSGDCHQCSGCGATQQTLTFTARNPIGAKPGDLVLVHSSSAPVLAGAAVVYLLPLVFFFAGYLLGEQLWQRGGLVAFAAFGVALVLARCYDRLVAAKRKTEYTIIGYGPKGSQT